MKDIPTTFKTPVFPVSELKSKFPVKGKPDTLSGQPIQEVTIKKSNKDEVAYQDNPKNGKRCFNCEHFDAPVSCYGVNGRISINGWCAHYDENKSIGQPIREE